MSEDSNRYKPIYQADINKIKNYLDEISEYINPDGGGAIPDLTELKKLITRINNRLSISRSEYPAEKLK